MKETEARERPLRQRMYERILLNPIRLLVIIHPQPLLFDYISQEIFIGFFPEEKLITCLNN